MSDQSLPAIPGYTLTTQLYVGRHTVVYRAIGKQTGGKQTGGKQMGGEQTGGKQTSDEQAEKSVVIKLLKSHALTFNELVRFRNQYIIAKNLAHPSIIKPIAMVPVNHGYALVMEDVGGLSLRDYLQTHSRLSIEQVLSTALQLTESLHHLSQHRVLHKDINPANILIHPDTHQVWLTDFGLASQLPQENQELQSPGTLEGTLAYIAPEQTGRMNRGIDYRTDFYSLGVTLYELLTGELPFQSDDPLELIHCHIAKVPVPPCEGSLSDIVLKLMAKNAEDRYQSALGLKHDLQHCLNQWTETKAVADFELGQQDVCDRFLIPEKLYGRKAEVQRLMNAFERVSQGASELILVAGFSGIGKTAVVNEVHKPITQQKGYFIKGKFDQLNRNIPFSAFVQAFRHLMGQLLGESEIALENWKTKILTAVGEQGQVLIEVIPELALILGPQPAAPALSGTAAQNRFNRLFSKFIQVFTTAEHPLVIFLDDLQWIDVASLPLFQRLVDQSSGYLLLLGAYRDNEVSAAHPLMRTLNEIQTTSATVHTLTLKALKQDDVNQLVAQSLHCAGEIAIPLTQLVYQKTQGNPFFATQFLQVLQADGWIEFEADVGHWQCDLSQVRSLALTDDVVEFMVGRLQQWPQTTQNALAIAACLGNQFDLETLAIVCEQSPEQLTQALWPALQSGLLIPETETYKFFQGSGDAPITTPLENHHVPLVAYRFLHDRVQQAAYALISESKKAHAHYQIGQRLVQQSPRTEETNRIFAMVGQLNAGSSIISTQTERDQLAQLNLKACQQAKSATAYRASYEYAQTGLSLLGDALLGDASPWQRQYDLTLSLHNLLASAALLCGEFDRLETTVATTTESAESVVDKIPAYVVLIQSKIFQNKRLEAIQIGLKTLEQLGISIHLHPAQADIERSIEQVTQLLTQQPISSLVNLPVMKDPTAISTMQVAMAIIPSAYSVVPQLCGILITLTVEKSIRYGNGCISAFAYSSYATIACNILKDVKLGQQLAQLAQAVITRFNARAFEPSVSMTVGIFVTHRCAHLRDSFPLLKVGYTTALDMGDLESAGINAQLLCQHLFYSGEELDSWIVEAQNYHESLSHFYPLTARYCQLTIGAVQSLRGCSSSSDLLAKDLPQESDILAIFQSEPDSMGLSYFYIYKVWLCYLFGKWELAQQYADHARENYLAIAGLVPAGVFLFLDSLTTIASFVDEKEQDNLPSLLGRVESNQQELMQHWASHAPMNYQHKVDLVEAEKCRVLGQKLDAIERYDIAIAGAQKNKYIHEEALANELAARFYLDWGKEKIAAIYMQEAYCCYERWGAKAKTDDLETRYASLLQQPNAIDPLTTLHGIAPLTLSVHSVSSSFQPAQGTVNQALDLATIFKAAQALSESTNLSGLLEKLAPMMLQTSGSERLALLLPNAENGLQIKLMATAETTQLISTPLDSHSLLPAQLIQYVQRTQEIVVLDAEEITLPVVDVYLNQHPHRSVLCAPLLHQSKLIGLLYLEHHSVAGVFNRDRITILNFLCNQAAISLENALLNQALEQKIQAQTKKLRESETRLKNMINNIPGVVYQFKISADGEIDSINYISPDCYDLYEVTAEAFMGGEYGFRDFEHSEDRPMIDQMLTETIPGAQTFQHEFRIVTLSGTVKWVQVFGSSRPQLDGTGLWDGVILDVSDRKAAELALQDTQTQFRRMTENVPGMIYRYVLHTDGSDELTYVSSQVRELFELEPDIALQDSDQVWARIHPDDVPWVGEAIQASAETLQPFTPVYRLLLPEAGLRWVQTMSSAKRLDNGDVVWDGIVVDISDRKQAEEELKALSQRLELALDSADIGIWEWNSTDNRLIWDQRMFSLYGIDPDNFSGQYEEWVQRIHPDDVERMTQQETQTLLEQGSATSEFKIIRPDHQVGYIHSNVIAQRNEQGDLVRMIGLNMDISDRKAAELALEQEILRQTSIFNTSPDAIHIMDVKGNLLEANANFFKTLGYTPEESRHLTAFDWDAKYTRVELQEKLSTPFLEMVGTIKDETLHRRKDGSIFPVHLSVSAMLWHEQMSFICIARDVSDLKAAEAQLQRTNEELVRATRLKDEFLANMSHELRTPLNAILGLSEGLQDEVFGPLNEQQLKYIKTIERSGTHLLNLINDILDVAKIEAGQLELTLKATHIDSLCNASLAFVKQQAFKKHISLTHQMPPQALTLQLDERRILQSLVNLLNNAVKFTPEGGSVTLAVSCHPQPTEYQQPFNSPMPSKSMPSKASKNPNKCEWGSGPLPIQPYITFSVSDTGIGIAQEHINTLFTPFSQVDSTLTRKYMGTGLGLVLVKQMIELHGGTVSLTSEIDVGSCFSLHLPYEVAPSSVKPADISSHISPLSGPQAAQADEAPLILLAEDNEDTINLMMSYLTNVGYRLIVAKNGLDAIELAKTHAPDIILMDIQMPGLDGLESIQRIRQVSKLAQVPIIALTALAMTGDQERCLAAGANTYLSKPVKLKQLVQNIQKLLV